MLWKMTLHPANNQGFLRLQFLCFFILVLLKSYTVYAAASDSLAISPNWKTATNTYTFAELGWDNKVTLNGYAPVHTFYLPIAKKINPQKAILHLKVNFSPLLSEETRLDIKFNDTILRRISLPADVTQELSLDIELPPSQFSKDWQALEFMAYLAGSANLCNPNLWIYISPESSITITSISTPFSASLNQLPGLFVNPATLGPVPLMLLLPPQTNQQEIFSLLNLSLHLGSLSNNRKIMLNVKSISELTTEEKNQNLILIGIIEHLGLNTLTSSILAKPAIRGNQQQNSGFLMLAPSPFNNLYGLLTITGNNFAALHKAIEALFMPEFSQMATGQTAIVHQVKQNDEEKVIPNWYQTSLKKLGYPDQSVSGLGKHKLTYDIPLPNNRTPTGSKVKTYITAPGFTGKDSSQITLLVNGLKQSSFILTQEHSAWNVDIDVDAMKPGVNTLEYIINLHLKDERCTLINYDQVWATIHSETQFDTLFFEKFPQATLNQLPVPFAKEITLVVPAQLSKQDISNLTHFMFTFGRLMQPNFISFNFLDSATATEEYIRTHNIILYGTAAKNPWVQFAFDYMPFRLKNNERNLMLSQKTLTLEGQNATGLLELVSSPWSETHAVFLMSGTDEAGLAQAVNTFTDDKLRNDLNGNIALINSDHSVQIINSDDARYIPLKNQVWLHIKNWARNSLFYVTHHPQVFIYLFVFLVPLYIYLRRRKKQ
ncbi:cellulose biosynthesis cyclic di-GMP-binding regulatory protein BcsB [Legionella septentrionalis]|uniref:Cyclic di-GMP-binding protein n=1 Tax=Legionella septentrionalis TaxID=2498109 RepID=A0A433JH33_9GAMM|nr:cellulose biosynthesis cyclic di-GMP-binding regulatory protein BcsB [Legionella septentrionalis]RUQ81566.1 hypothetical protein EKM59_10295 [Legionella septentrionalis]